MIPLAVVHPSGAGKVTFRVYAEGEATVCELHVTGRLRLPLCEWLKVFRDTLKEIENRARENGCTEVRIAGRNWSRVFPDYEPMIGPTNGLRKRL